MSQVTWSTKSINQDFAEGTQEGSGHLGMPGVPYLTL